MDERIVNLLREARRELEHERGRRFEPIAIIGIGCRFPGGASNLGALWRILEAGTDASSDVPADRWDADALYDPNPDAPGKAFVKRGGFLDQVDEFDPEFFGISPREAMGMDPQQRLLLEVVWEALEDAAIAPASLSGSATGVWVGLCFDDYAMRSISSGDLSRIDAYSALGNTRSIAAGRISYVLNLSGPAVQLDTACSSSLVAVHQACQSLRSGESDLALVGGVNVMSSPEATVALCRLRALAPDGRCKAFDAAADGYGRGEGCGVVVLERLSDALARGHHIHAIVRGSAVNHDGRSNGLTAPSGTAQEAVIRAALSNAGLDASAIDYVEAHGTGTLLGDPIEILALGRTYARERQFEQPLYVGTVKTNFGHLEGAAGIAGLIKLALCLSKGQIAASLNFKHPNPKIPWERLPIRVPTQLTSWEARGGTRIGAVSSFGISGTNAHVILERSPERQQMARPPRSAELIVLSAKTEDALKASARRLREWAESETHLNLGDVAGTLISGRAALDCRLALAVSTRQELVEALKEAEAAEPEVNAVATTAGKVVFVFPGQGSQWIGMGRRLLLEEPEFRATLEKCDRAIQLETGWSVLDELRAPPESSRLERVDVVQPVLFAFQVALAALWRSWGVEPQAVVGHSLGEVAAACVAGAISVEDGAAIVCRRSRLLRNISGRGQMALVELSASEAHDTLAGFEDRVTVAVSNSTRSTVLSGDGPTLTAILEKLERRGVFWRRVQVDVASHSPQVDPLLGELIAALSDLRPQHAQVPMYSTVSGAILTGLELRAPYWADNLRQPVHFARSVQSLLADGFSLFVEVSAHPLLVTAIDQIRAEQGVAGVATGSLRRDQPERLTLLASLGSLFRHGLSLSPERLFPHGFGRAEVPTYAWQRQRYWLAPPSASPVRAGSAPIHRILGARLDVAGSDAVFEFELSASNPAWLRDHRVAGQVVVPAALFAELIGAAGAEHRQEASVTVSRLVLQKPLLVGETVPCRVQIVVLEAGTRACVYARTPADGSSSWTLHASGDLGVSAMGRGPIDLADIERRCPQSIDVAAIYAAFAARGIVYTGPFQGLRALWRGKGEALAEINLDPTPADAYALHPALLDAALQATAGTLDLASQSTLLPFEIGSYRVYHPGCSRAFVHVKLVDASAEEQARADLVICNEAGQVLAEVLGLRLRRVDLATLSLGNAPARPDAVYRVEWQPAPEKESNRKLTGSWGVVPLGNMQDARALNGALVAQGASSHCIQPAALEGGHSAENVICLWDAASGADAAIAAAQQALAIAQALARATPPPRLWLVTRGAVAASPGENVSPAPAAVWGLARALMHELPELRCSIIDVEPDAPLAPFLLREFAAGDDENQVAWRQGHRRVARLVRAPEATAIAPNENFQLEARHKGSLDSLSLRATERRAPGAGEVEISVHASGLNFRDVLTALGMVDAGDLGGECSGIVTAIGAGVEGFALGDRVMALARGTFSRFVTVDVRLVSHVPPALSFEQAATIPAAFLTAWYALHDLARLKQGERLLVHAAAGGVGMAAIQVARLIGADVVATASPQKWDAVRSLGVRHVASSRDTDFARVFRESHGGVDVVLNCLTGEFVDAGLSLLAPGGRFIELGKVDIRDEAAIAASHPGTSYRAFDLVEAGMERLHEMLFAIRRALEQGDLQPLPLRKFDMVDAEGAFRVMAQARHIGKIILSPAGNAADSQGTVVITGGLGALGLEAARSLARNGFKRLLLTGRRGLETPGAAEAVAELTAMGAEVCVAAVDVAKRTELEHVLDTIPGDRPLTGIIHAAGLIDDGLLTEQTPERFTNVMAPKVSGAWNLHELTADQRLSFFVCFSSLAGTMGSASQGAYCAANAFLDALAAHRRARGLCGLSLAWGPWSGSGLAATLDEKLRARLTRQGIGQLDSARGVALLESAMQRAEAHLVLVPLDLRAAAAALGFPVPPLWRVLVRGVAAPTSAPENWQQRLAALPSERRLEVLTDDIRHDAARVLSLGSIGSVPPDRALKTLGLDSLMALELRNNIARRAGVTLPPSLIFDHPSPAAIAKFLLTEVLGLEQSSETLGPIPSSPTEPVSRQQARPIAALNKESTSSSVDAGHPVARCECHQHVEAPIARLLCFHDAAGTASTFVPFARLAAAEIEVHSVSVSRPTPILDTAPRAYLDRAVEYIVSLSDRPFVLLGHSLGALFALRIAEYLVAEKLPQPVLFVASAPPPPGDITLGEAAISSMFSHFLGSRARGTEMLRENFMADFFVCRNLPRGQLPLPKTPLVVFMGTEDPFVQLPSVETWRALTARDFSITTVPGNHFYIHHPETRELMLDELARCITGEVFGSQRAAVGDQQPRSRTIQVR